MIIDAHQHVFWHRRNDADLIADMDACGIDVAWALSWDVPPREDDGAYEGALNPMHVRPDGKHPGIVLSDQVLARDRYPDRFVVGYCPDPQIPGAAKLLEAAYHMHRVRVCGEWKFRTLLDDPRCLELFRKAGELGCPVVVHIDVPYRPHRETGREVYQPMWYGGTVENLARALDACGETIFLGHSPGFWREISADAATAPAMYPDGPVVPGGRLYELFEKYPNLHADLSAGSGLGALKRDPDHAQSFLCRFADRLLFGRDDHGRDLHDFLQSLDLPQDVREKIYSRNALRLVHWPVE